MLPTSNFEPIRCTLLSVRAFDFDDNLCAFSVKNGADAAGAEFGSPAGSGDKNNYLSRFGEGEQRKRYAPIRTKDKFVWKALHRTSSSNHSQVRLGERN